MEKIIIHRPGSFNRLKYESFPTPVVKENEVLVETKAIGVNYADCVVRMGYYASAKKYIGWPITPGFEFSGTVSAIGNNITDLQVGTRVFGLTRFNSYSTHIVVPRNQLFLLPENISFEQAGCFPVVYLTAHYAVNMSVHIFPGSTLLIHSAAGGVGSALLQLCNLRGWTSIGVVGSSHKVQAAKEMGADFVIDKSKEDLWSKVQQYAPEGLDVVLDGNGAPTLKEGFKHLRPTGKLISYGFHSMFPRGKGTANSVKLMYNYLRTPKFNPVSTHSKNVSIVTFNLSFLFERNDLLKDAMKTLNKWLAEGSIKMPKITTYPFKNAVQAHKDLQSGNTIGKLVLVT